MFSSDYGRDYFLYNRFFCPPKTPLLLENSNFSYLSNHFKHAQTLLISPEGPMLDVNTSTTSTESIKPHEIWAALGRVNYLLVWGFCRFPLAFYAFSVGSHYRIQEPRKHPFPDFPWWLVCNSSALPCTERKKLPQVLLQALFSEIIEI